MVQDAVIGPDRMVIVLDSHFYQLRVFAAEGGHLRDIGRGGAGPGEFGEPVALTASADGRFYVLDRRYMRVTEYVAADDSIRVGQGRPVDVIAFDMCALGDELFLLAGAPDALVKVIDRSGTATRTFGSPPAVDPDIPKELEASARRAIAGGRIACDPASATVYITENLGRTVTAYSSAGQRKWTSNLERFLETEVVRADLSGGRLGYTFSVPADGGEHHRVVAASVLPGGPLIVQYAAFDHIRRIPGEREIVTVAMNPESGEEVARATSLPIVSAVDDVSAIAYLNAPFPRVAAFSIEAIRDALHE